MPDYIYLLENRLSTAQQNALRTVRDVAREAEMILFLTGDAVRDLTSGHAVRDLEVAVCGDALKLKKAIEQTGAAIWGEDTPSRSLFLCFPGTVRMDLVSTQSVEYPKPGQPVYQLGSIHDELRHRDFTGNAMAISLNEGSYGLLIDPLNGAADIEARTLRLVSNYGFLEDPSLLIRATRYRTRLGWELDPKTQTRFDNAQEEGVIEHLSHTACSRELEQIGHEDDGLRILQAYEAEGWMKVLFAPWTTAKADEEKLKALHALAVDLAMQGVHPDLSAAQMQLLTAKLAPKDLATLKKQLLRPGFVQEWNNLDAGAAAFRKVLLDKENQTPSKLFKIFTSYKPEDILWLCFTTKDGAVKAAFEQFLKTWPEVKQKIPYALMQEMRIRPELPNYQEIVHSIFLELIDGKLETPEAVRAFLEPFSPPAPPPQVTIKRTRAKRSEAKIKETFDDEEESEEAESEDDLDDMGGDDDEIGIGLELPKVSLEADGEDGLDSDEAEDAEEDDAEDEEEDDRPEPPPVKRSGKAAAKQAAPAPHKPTAPKPAAPKPQAPKPAPPAPAPKAPAQPPVQAPAKAPAKANKAEKPAAKIAPAPAKPKAAPPVKKAPPAKKAPAPKAPAKKATLKATAKPAHKAVAKPPVKAKAAAAKPKPAAKAKSAPAPKGRPAAHKPAGKGAAKKRS